MARSRPTLHDVATLAGVSKSLVSLALAGSPKVSDASRARIKHAAAELGYRPNAAARSLKVRRSQTIGVLILDLHNPVFAEILDGVQTEVRQHGFSTMLISGSSDPALEQAEIDTLLRFQIEGLILIAHRLPETILRTVAAEVPTVVVSRDDLDIPYMDSVSNNDVEGARMAVDHLVSLGHRRIVHLNGGDNPVSHARADGYRRAMTDHGLSEFIQIVLGGLTDAAGFAATSEALQYRPTALFVANDVAAMGAIAAIENVNLRVPEDISVIGYDGIRIGGMRRVNLTTIAQPLAELGRRAAQHMLRRIDNRDVPAQHEHLPASLVIRGTTGPFPVTSA